MELPVPMTQTLNHRLAVTGGTTYLVVKFDEVSGHEPVIKHCYHYTEIESSKFYEFFKNLKLPLALTEIVTQKKGLRFVNQETGFVVIVKRSTGSYKVSEDRIPEPSIDPGFELKYRNGRWYRRAKVLVTSPSDMSSEALQAGASSELILSTNDHAWELLEIDQQEVKKAAEDVGVDVSEVTSTAPAAMMKILGASELADKPNVSQDTDPDLVLFRKCSDWIEAYRAEKYQEWHDLMYGTEAERSYVAPYMPPTNGFKEPLPQPDPPTNTEAAACDRILNPHKKSGLSLVKSGDQAAYDDDVPF